MKKFLSLLCAVCFTAGIFGAVPVSAKEPSVYYLLRPDSFSSLGEWVIKERGGAFGGSVLEAPENTVELTGEPAKTTLSLENGTYYIWVRSMDCPEYLPGYRTFLLRVNGQEYAPAQNSYFGQHGIGKGTDSNNSSIAIFWWEQAAFPSSQVEVTDHQMEIEAVARKDFAKFDSIIVTNDPDFVPENPKVTDTTYSYDTIPAKVPSNANVQACLDRLLEFCTVPDYYAYEKSLEFPSYAQQEGTVGTTVSLSNPYVTIDFRQVNDGTHAFVQRQTIVDGHRVDAFTDGLGWLTLFADSSKELSVTSIPVFAGSYGGEEFGTKNVFKAGFPSWILPQSLQALPDGSIEMTGENEFAALTARWTLGKEDREPTVQVSFTTKKEGSYSFGMMYSPQEINPNDVKFVQVPFRYQEKALPEAAYLVAESFSTTALTQATTKTGLIVPEKDVTYGIAVDPSVLKYRWSRTAESYTSLFPSSAGGNKILDTGEEQSDYGLSILGKNKGVLPGLFAPLMGSMDSRLEQGQTFTYAYRPMATVSEPSVGSWFDAYSHVVEDILQVTDYRNNYFASMTDTIFNIRDLLMDDYHSGWDADGKAHYNMEARNIVSNADPLAYLQYYLLTEDPEVYERRTLPSMEYMLSRKGSHFAYAGPIDEGNGLSADLFGSSSAFLTNFAGNFEGYAYLGLEEGKGNGFGNSVYTGAYKMTLGQVPAYRKISAENFNGTYIAQANDVGVKNPAEHLWKYALTQNAVDLNNARSNADQYLEKRVNTPVTEVVPDSSFIFMDYFPNFHCFLDLYEQTGEQKYLDGAVEAARRMLPTLWSAPMPQENETISLHSGRIMEFAALSRGSNTYWHGDRRFRLGVSEFFDDILGYVPVSWKDGAVVQKDEIIPQWVTARVGLGLEQASTFFPLNSNVSMSTWAPDLMRLAQLSGDRIFETYARNAIVGRFANYPGYYLNNMYTYPSQVDYPYQGPDTTNIYYHHIPVLMSALEDFLISQGYHWSNQKVDFPSVRSQGYAWFSNRHYGFAPGKVFEEDGMWLWLKKGLVEIGSQQIDWFGAKKDGRAAFVFMNASDEPVTTEASFGKELGVSNKTTLVYNADGSTSPGAIANGKTELTVPARSLVAVAFDAPVSSPDYAQAYSGAINYPGKETAMGGTHVAAELIDDGIANKNDINGYVLQIDPHSYHAYISINRRPQTAVYKRNGQTQDIEVDKENGINGAILKYRTKESAQWTTLEDYSYPFEFTVKVDDPQSQFQFQVEFIRETGKIAMDEILTMTSTAYVEDPYDGQMEVVTPTKKGNLLCGISYSATSNPAASGWTSNCLMASAGNYYAFCYVKNHTEAPVNATVLLTLVDGSGRFIRVAKILNKTIPVTASDPYKLETVIADPIVVTEEEKGCHLQMILLDSEKSLRPLGSKVDFIKK